MSVRDILGSYATVESGKPILAGHIMAMFDLKYGSHNRILDWANGENAKNSFPPILLSKIKKYSMDYKSRYNKGKSKFADICQQTAHVSTLSNVTIKTAPVTAPTHSTSAHNETFKKKFCALHKSFFNSQRRWRLKVWNLNNDFLKLKERYKKSTNEVNKLRDIVKKSDEEKPLALRKLYYDCIFTGMAGAEIPVLMHHIADTLNLQNIGTSQSTVERMVWELGFFADYATTAAIFNEQNLTLQFDSTTQDEMHVNCILITTPSSYHLVSLEALPGGTAPDYKQHICRSVRHLADVYSIASKQSYAHCLEMLVTKINSCMTDRAPVNHATVVLLEKEWEKNLVEVNCNLQPLEAVCRVCTKALAELEGPTIQAILPGSECLAWKIVWAMNTINFSPKKGDIMAFGTFLEKEGIQKSMIPRFRGNRLHIMFLLGGLYYAHFQEIKTFLTKYVHLEDFKKDLQRAFDDETAAVELQVMGVIGKLLTGPWMSTFYTSVKSQVNTKDTVSLVKGVLNKLKRQIQDPDTILFARNDFFGNELDFANDEILQKVMMTPINPTLFNKMVKACLEAILDGLKKQYEQSFTTLAGVTDEALSSAKQHTMLAEGFIGEFCERKKLAPNVSVCHISNSIKAKKYGLKEFIGALDASECSRLLHLAVPRDREDRMKLKQRREFIERRVTNKRSREEAANRGEIQKILKNLQVSDQTLQEAFPEIPDEQRTQLKGIMMGKPGCRSIKHYWDIDGEIRLFYGEIEKFHNNTYTVFYYESPADYDVGDDEMISAYELATDFITKDLSFY